MIALCGALTIAWASAGRASSAAESRQWALIIAVQQYDRPQYNLKYTLRDAALLRRVLVERGGLPSDQVVELTDASAEARLRPTRDNILREVEQQLSRAELGPNDRLLVFFAGHGVLVDGVTYLAPANFDLARPRETGVPIQRLHDALAKCEAGVKFLVLDACHAAGLSADAGVLDSEALGDALDPDDIPGCVVLASCKRNQVSYEWKDRQQGLFTYWLCRGLEGGADRDGNGRISIDEAYDYAYKQVEAACRAQPHVFRRRQTPVRLIGLQTEGTPDVLSLLPEPPETACRRLAEELDLAARQHGIERIGVLEFATPQGATLALARANLPKFCAERIRVAMHTIADAKYRVIDQQTLAAESLLATMTPEDMGDPIKLRALAADPQGCDAVVWGVLRRSGQQIELTAELLGGDGARLANCSSVLPLSEDLIGDLGVSFDNRDRPGGGPYAPEVVQQVFAEAETHPLQAPDFPFEVEVWAIDAADAGAIDNNTPRHKLEFFVNPARDGRLPELCVAAEPGQYFEVRVTNRSQQDAAMVLLIDGLNSLGQQRERLGNARYWVLRREQDPGLLQRLELGARERSLSPVEERLLVVERRRDEEAPVSTIDGWTFLQAGAGVGPANATARRFRFVDLAESVAYRNHFTDSVGVITAAFYAERGKALGVGEGPNEHRRVHMTQFQPGRLLGVVNIRYVDARTLE